MKMKSFSDDTDDVVYDPIPATASLAPHDMEDVMVSILCDGDTGEDDEDDDLTKSKKHEDPDEVTEGVEDEMTEHGLSRRTARKFVSDHLKKDPHYYSKVKAATKKKFGNRSPPGRQE